MATALPSTASPEQDRVRHRAISAVFRARIACDASEIRAARAELRQLQREGSDLAPGRQSSLWYRRLRARAWLIAYGLHRGRALERMECGRTSLDELPFDLAWRVGRAREEAEEEAEA